MINPLSMQTYRDNLESGLLSKRRTQAYRYLMRLQRTTGRSATSSEVWVEVHRQHPRIPQRSIDPRWEELEQQGVVRRAYVRPCHITGRRCMTWEIVPDGVAKPFKPAKRPRCETCNQKLPLRQL